jgi:hypothetical protein
VQVKGGATGRGDIAKLKGDMDREGAPMGVLMTLHEPTADMKREAALAGAYQYSAATAFPKIQILSLKDWFAGRMIKLPVSPHLTVVSGEWLEKKRVPWASFPT